MTENLPQPAPSEVRATWVSDALLIAFGSAFAYFLAFAYERGYCGVFGVPESFIRPDLSVVMGFALGMYTLGMFVLLIADGLFKLSGGSQPAARSAIQRFIRLRGPAILYGLILLIVNGLSRGSWIPPVVLVGFLFVFDVLPAIVTTKKHGSFDAALHASLNQGNATPNIFDPIRQRFGEQTVLLTLICIWAVIIAGDMGRSAARRETRFLVPDAQPDSIVVRVYGGSAICVAVDRAERRLKGDITVLTLEAAAKGVRLHWEQYAWLGLK